MTKWKDMTPKQLERVSQDLSDHAHDMGIDREHMIEEVGFDVVAATECVARRLDREARRRAASTAALGVMKEVVIEGHKWTVHVRYDVDHAKWSYELFIWPATEVVRSATSATLSGMFFTLLAHYHVTVAPAVLDEALPSLLKLRRDAQRRRVEQVKASLKEALDREVVKLVPNIVPADAKAHAKAFSDEVTAAMNAARAKDWIRTSVGAVEADGVEVAHATDITINVKVGVEGLQLVAGVDPAFLIPAPLDAQHPIYSRGGEKGSDITIRGSLRHHTHEDADFTGDNVTLSDLIEDEGDAS